MTGKNLSYIVLKLNITYHVDRFLSGFDYGHASVRMHYVKLVGG